MADLEDYLAQGKQSGNEVLLLCPFHPDNNPSLSFNTDKQVYLCRSCGAKGHASQLARHLNLTYEDSIRAVDKSWGLVGYRQEGDRRLWGNTGRMAGGLPVGKAGPAAKMSLDDAVNYYNQTLLDRHHGVALQYLLDRGFGIEDVIEYKLGACDEAVVIPHIFGGKAVQLKARSLDPTADPRYFALRKGGKAIPFAIDKALRLAKEKEQQSIVLVEGEFDCISHYKLFPTIPCVGIPGKTSFKKEWVELFKDFKKIYFCFDNELGIESDVDKIASLLGRYRCLTVKLDGVKDLNELLISKGQKEAKRIYKEAVTKCNRLGKELVRSIADFTNDALKYIIDGVHEGYSTGIEEVDSVFGGIREGELILLTGFPGTGKTTFALTLAHTMAVRHEVKTLCCMFENSSATDTLPTLAGIHAGCNFKLQRDRVNEFSDAVQNLSRISVLDRFASTSVDEVVAGIKLAYDDGVRFVVIDHLHFFLDNHTDNDVMDAAIKSFSRLTKEDCPGLTILLLAQPRKPDERFGKTADDGKSYPMLYLHSIKGSGVSYEAAHTVLLLQKDDRGTYLEAAKLRSDATNCQAFAVKCRLDLDKKSLRYKSGRFEARADAPAPYL